MVHSNKENCIDTQGYSLKLLHVWYITPVNLARMTNGNNKKYWENYPHLYPYMAVIPVVSQFWEKVYKIATCQII